MTARPHLACARDLTWALRAFSNSLAALAILALTEAAAAAVELSVTTDKPQYRPGEALQYLITARNTDSSGVTLTFGSTLQTQYSVDGASFRPDIGLDVMTSVTIPGHGAYTWDYRHDWSRLNLASGEHTVTGRINAWAVSPRTAEALFEVVPPTLPTDNFLIDFDALPGTATRVLSITEYWPFGVRLSGGLGREYPGNDGDNQFVWGGSVTADFDMPVYEARATTSTTAGRIVTMVARDAEGQVLATSSALPAPGYQVFSAPLSIRSDRPIASIEWLAPGDSGVYVDDLYVGIVAAPEPATATVAAGGILLLARRSPRAPTRLTAR
jgi:hypothetical protein